MVKNLVNNSQSSQLQTQSTFQQSQTTQNNSGIQYAQSRVMPLSNDNLQYVVADALAPLAQSTISQQVNIPQQVVVDTVTTTTQVQPDGSLRRSVSRERKNLSSASKPSLPPLPPKDHMDSSKNLRRSMSGSRVVSTTTTTVTQQPTFIPQQQPVVVTTLRTSRASSSHGEPGQLLRVSSRPSSSHGAASSNIIINSPIPVITTTTNIPTQFSTQFSTQIPSVITIPGITTPNYIGMPVNTNFNSYPGGTSIPIRTTVGSPIDTRPNNFINVQPMRGIFTTGTPVIKQQTAYTPMTSDLERQNYISPHVTNLINNLKREISADKFKNSTVTNQEISINSNYNVPFAQTNFNYGSPQINTNFNQQTFTGNSYKYTMPNQPLNNYGNGLPSTNYTGNSYNQSQPQIFEPSPSTLSTQNYSNGNRKWNNINIQR